MALKIVALTGADDAVNPVDLLKLAEEYPFVEFGILFSQSRQGKEQRYPSLDWIRILLGLLALREKEGKPTISISAHLCGAYARSIFNGEWIDPIEVLFFDRVQLNIAREPQSADLAPILKAISDRRSEGQPIIIQAGENITLAHTLCYQFGGIYTLFDRSGGEGQLPAYWPMIILPMSGYAGGLSPDNLAEQLPRIAEAADNADYWIDTESGIRTDDRFDLDKARRFLDIAARWVKP